MGPVVAGQTTFGRYNLILETLQCSCKTSRQNCVALDRIGWKQGGWRKLGYLAGGARSGHLSSSTNPRAVQHLFKAFWRTLAS